MLIQDQATFYVTGGTIPPDAPSYVERAADRELLAALQRGELCYVLNARQMGKSSLSVRTRQSLEAAGTRTAFLDLQKFGSSASAEQWYRALLERIGSDLKLRASFLTYWRDNSELPPLARLFGALRDVALEQIPGNIVVFLDEIDVVRDLGFKTDEFFGAIRESHNARADDPALKRLTFCIIGTVAPTDLIRDVRLSPFNIGTRMTLADFTTAEAMPLATRLPASTKTLERILWWTNGHPYLTQRLCAELTTTSAADVDAMVARLFFAKSDAELDENIKNVRNSMLRASDVGVGFDRTDLLNRYGAIVSGKRVPDDDTDGLCTALRLTGLIASADGRLCVRNRVYSKLFDLAWVRNSLPDAEVRRQREAVARARWQIGSIGTAVLLVMCSLTVWAIVNARSASTMSKASNQAYFQVAVAEMDEKAALVQAKADRSAAQKQVQLALQAKRSADAATAVAKAALEAESTAKRSAVANASRADRAALVATAQATRADRASAAAISQAARADRASADAIAQAAAANHLAYISAINLTDQNIENGRYSLAEQFFSDASTFAKSERGCEWDYLRGRFHPEQLLLASNQAVVTSVAFSPDGKRIVTGRADGTANEWDASTARDLLIIKGHAGSVTSAAFSQDGQRIVTGSNDYTAKVWDAATGKELVTLKGHTAPIASVSFSPDGKRVVTGSYDKTAKVWDASTAKELMTLRGHTSEVMAAAFSPDGERIVTGGDATAKVWDAGTGTELMTFKGHTNWVKSAAFSPDGKRIVTSGYDNTAKIWDSGTAKVLMTLRGHTGCVASASFSRDGKRIVTGSFDTTAKVWDVATGKELKTFKGHTDLVASAAFSPDGKRIATASWDGTAREWDLDAADFVTIKDISASSSPAFSADGKRIAFRSLDSKVKVWDVATAQDLQTINIQIRTGGPVALSPDGRRVVTVGGYGNKTATIWDVQTAKVLATLSGHTNSINSVAFSPDGKRIVTGSKDKTIKMWDAATAKVLATFERTEPVDSASFSPDGKRLVIVNGDNDMTVNVSDASSGAPLIALKGHRGTITSASYSTDGERIGTSSIDGTAKIWDAATGKELLTLKGHKDPVYSVAFSPDGKRVITGGQDTTAKVWDAATARELVTLRGHTNVVHSAAFSPDGKSIITESWDNTARIWRRPTDVQLAAMENYDRKVETVVERAEQQSELDALAKVPLDRISESASALVSKYPKLSRRIALLLNNAAFPSVDPNKKQAAPDVAKQALEAATLAVAYGDPQDGNALDTLAAAQLACGDLDLALATERKAVQLSSTDKTIAASMAATLKRYEALAANRKAPPK